VTYPNEGLKEIFGKFKEVLPAGLHKINPFTEKLVIVNKKTKVKQ
jgi:regulator of protease activity HflC (stomatin/prohibitin superfamily)